MLVLFGTLLLTIIIEAIVIWAFLKQKPAQIILYTAIINGLTQPIATYLYLYYFNSLLLVELLVFLVEIILIKVLFEIKWQKAILISFVANLITALISYLI